MTGRVRFQQGTTARVLDHQAPELALSPQPGTVSLEMPFRERGIPSHVVTQSLGYSALRSVRSADMQDFSAGAVDHVDALVPWRIQSLAEFRKQLERRLHQFGKQRAYHF